MSAEQNTQDTPSAPAAPAAPATKAKTVFKVAGQKADLALLGKWLLDAGSRLDIADKAASNLGLEKTVRRLKGVAVSFPTVSSAAELKRRGLLDPADRKRNAALYDEIKVFHAVLTALDAAKAWVK